MLTLFNIFVKYFLIVNNRPRRIRVQVPLGELYSVCECSVWYFTKRIQESIEEREDYRSLYGRPNYGAWMCSRSTNIPKPRLHRLLTVWFLLSVRYLPERERVSHRPVCRLCLLELKMNLSISQYSRRLNDDRWAINSSRFSFIARLPIIPHVKRHNIIHLFACYHLDNIFFSDAGLSREEKDKHTSR